MGQSYRSTFLILFVELPVHVFWLRYKYKLFRFALVELHVRSIVVGTCHAQLYRRFHGILSDHNSLKFMKRLMCVLFPSSLLFKPPKWLK